MKILRALLLLVLLLSATQAARAEAQNAKDVRGRFVLVVFGAAAYRPPLAISFTGTGRYHLPLTVIGTFDSFEFCTSAGRELQARANNGGYTLDFSCLAEGRLSR